MHERVVNETIAKSFHGVISKKNCEVFFGFMKFELGKSFKVKLD
jgi:hypothetical protein